MEFLKQEEFKDKFGIYGIVNHINGDVYIGQTKNNFLKRYWHHAWKLKDNTHDNQHLQYAWNLYGENSFSFIPLKIVDNNDDLDELEIKYINIMRELNHCYNILNGGNVSRRGIPLTEKHKRLIGEKNRQHMLGSKHTDETKRKMSETRTGVRIKKSTDILNKELVIKIKKMLIDGSTATEVSSKLNVDYKLINNMISNNTWKDVVVNGWDEYRANRKTYTRLTKKDHIEIYRKHIEEGYTKYQLSEMYGKGVKMIEKILRDQKKSI